MGHKADILRHLYKYKASAGGPPPARCGRGSQADHGLSEAGHIPARAATPPGEGTRLCQVMSGSTSGL